MLKSNLTILYNATDKEGKKIINTRYFEWLKNLSCVVQCSVPIQRHHLRSIHGLKGGIGLKPPDIVAVPIDARLHHEIHNNGQKTFEEKYQIDLESELDILHSRFMKIIIEDQDENI